MFFDGPKVTKQTVSTVQERENADHLIVKDLQEQVSKDKLKILSKGSQLPLRNRLHQLNAFLD